jgi:adenosine deaminase
MSTTGAELTAENIRRAPKVLLHDHLDGGLRPATVVELAEACGYDGLPSTNPVELGHWFVRAANSGSLELFLETFAHAVAVLQTAEALTRVAMECAEDLSLDGVVYAEVRFAPELHTELGLKMDQVVEAVVRGFAEGERRAAAAGRPIVLRALLCAMRHTDKWGETAALAVQFRDRGVAGFDIAGPELGFPADRHVEAFDSLRSELVPFTVHAGEADGVSSIATAVSRCGASRIGHGVRILDDIEVSGSTVKLGRLASYVRDRRIALELCPSSNVQTGAAASISAHPIGLLTELRFNVTVNTDDRLMVGCSMTSEMAALSTAFGYGWADLEWFTVNAMKSAFYPHDRRTAIINEVIRPGYAALSR